MLHFSHIDFEVEIIDDPDYKIGLENNRINYTYTFTDEGDKSYKPVSKHAVMVYKNGALYKNAIILASGGGTGVHEGSALLDGSTLIVRCCNKVFSIELPELELNWITEVDQATCFSVEKYRDTYICHGELSICRLSREGKILWQVGGRDIFVNDSHYGSTFDMLADRIELMDWQGYRYILSYDGIIQDDTTNPFGKVLDQQTVPNILKELKWKVKKPWWKFW